MRRSRLPKDGVIRLRNDPGTIGKQLAVTVLGLFSVVGIMIAVIYTQGDQFDADIDKDAVFRMEEAPEEPAGPAPEQGGSDESAIEAPVLGNVTAP